MFASLRATLRRLGQQPGLSALSVLILVLGIGPLVFAWTVLFTEGAFELRRDPALARVGLKSDRNAFWEQQGAYPMSWALYRELMQATDCFEVLTASPGYVGDKPVVWGDQRLKAHVCEVDSCLLDLVDHHPSQGRRLKPEDTGPDGEAEGVMLSPGFWCHELDSDPKAIGSLLRVDGRPVRILGIQGGRMALKGLDDMGLYLPFDPSKAHFQPERQVSVVARLKPGVSLAQAQQQLARAHRLLAPRFPELKTSGLEVLPLPHGATLITWLSMAAIGLPFYLIACLAVAGLQLARSLGREEELALRSALGASRIALLRTHLGEPLILGLIAALLAWGPSHFLWCHLNPEAPDLGRAGLGIFAGVVCAILMVTVLAGLLPAWRAGNIAPSRILGRGLTTTQGRRTLRWQRALCAFQVALSMGLVGSAALFTDLLHRLTHVQPFPAFEQVVMGHFPARDGQPLAPGNLNAATQWLREQPGVEAVCLGYGDATPSSLQVMPFRTLDTGQVASIGGSSWETSFLDVTGLKLLAGRWPQNRQECALSRSAAERFWGAGVDPGRILSQSIESVDPGMPLRWRVVGLVQDARSASPWGEPGAPLAHAYRLPESNWADYTFLARMRGSGSAWLPSLTRALADRVPDQEPKAPVSPSAEQKRSPFRNLALFLMGMGLLALFIQALGILVLVRYLVEQRRRELGVRMALGADHRQLSREVLWDALRLTAWGLPFGVLAMLLGACLCRTFFMHVAWLNVSSLLIALASNLAATLLACLPALARLRRLSPVSLLREV